MASGKIPGKEEKDRQGLKSLANSASRLKPTVMKHKKSNFQSVSTDFSYEARQRLNPRLLLGGVYFNW
jgi:hypothetical protein